MKMPARRSWAIVCLTAYALLVAVVVFTPVSYSRIVNGTSSWLRADLGLTFFGSGWIEFTANIVMFLPLGFLLTVVFRHPWYGAVLAVAITIGVETAQIFIPDRQASLRDVISNSIGALIGTFLARLFVLRPVRKRAHAPKFELTGQRITDN